MTDGSRATFWNWRIGPIEGLDSNPTKKCIFRVQLRCSGISSLQDVAVGFFVFPHSRFFQVNTQPPSNLLASFMKEGGRDQEQSPESAAKPINVESWIFLTYIGKVRKRGETERGVRKAALSISNHLILQTVCRAVRAQSLFPPGIRSRVVCGIGPDPSYGSFETSPTNLQSCHSS